MALEARHPVSVLGGDDPLRVLARGTLLELGPATVRIRLDDEEPELALGRTTVVVVVHRTKVEMVLGERIELERDGRAHLITRVARAD